MATPPWPWFCQMFHVVKWGVFPPTVANAIAHRGSQLVVRISLFSNIVGSLPPCGRQGHWGNWFSAIYLKKRKKVNGLFWQHSVCHKRETRVSIVVPHLRLYFWLTGSRCQTSIHSWSSVKFPCFAIVLSNLKKMTTRIHVMVLLLWLYLMFLDSHYVSIMYFTVFQYLILSSFSTFYSISYNKL